MYIDIISYKLAENKDETALRDAAKDIFEIWMKKQPGFIKWEINRLTDGEKFQDFVYWQDKQSADEAQKRMSDIPANHPWLACYDMSSISSTPVNQIMTFNL